MNRYQSIDKSLELAYKKGVLQNITVHSEDKVCFDHLRHSIELYESNIDHKLFFRTNASITISNNNQ